MADCTIRHEPLPSYLGLSGFGFSLGFRSICRGFRMLFKHDGEFAKSLTRRIWRGRYDQRMSMRDEVLDSFVDLCPQRSLNSCLKMFHLVMQVTLHLLDKYNQIRFLRGVLSDCRLSAQRCFQRGINKGLIANSLLVRPGTCSLEHIIIEHDGDAGFSLAGCHRATLGFAEVVVLFHGSPAAVGLAFMGFCFPDRDQPNEIGIPICIGNHQDPTRSIVSNGRPALFVMILILDREGLTVIEHAFAICHMNLVLSQVRLCFSRVKLNPEFIHYAYLVCICLGSEAGCGQKDAAV